MAVSPEQARAELARRELAKRQQNMPTEQDEGSYLDKLPPPEGFFHKLPRNILAGLAKQGHTIMNTPYDIQQNLTGITPGLEAVYERYRGKKPQSVNVDLPHQEEMDFAKILGQQGEGTIVDKAIQKGVEFAPEILSGKALLKAGIKRLKGTHQLDIVQKAASKPGMNQFDYPTPMINEAKKFLPDTTASQELINAVLSGDYKAAFKMQSQIGHHQRKLEKSPLASENSIMAPKAAELKQNMLGHLDKVLRNTNHTEEADYLKNGINNYRQYKKVMEASKKVIKYLGVPTTLLTAVGLSYKLGKKALSDQ